MKRHEVYKPSNTHVRKHLPFLVWETIKINEKPFWKSVRKGVFLFSTADEYSPCLVLNLYMN